MASIPGNLYLAGVGVPQIIPSKIDKLAQYLMSIQI